MSNKKWNEEKIGTAKQKLYKFDTVKEAAEEMGETTSALRKAFKRNNLDSPSSFLEMEIDDLSVDDTEDRNCIKLNPEDQLYELYYNNNKYTLSFSDVEEICLLYTSQDGYGWTSSQISEHFVEHLWLTSDVLLWFLSCIGITHDSRPIPPHMLGTTEEDMYNAIRDRRDKIYNKIKQESKKTKKVKELEKELEEYIDVAKTCDYLYGLDTPKIKTKDIVENTGRTLIIPFADSHVGKRIKKQNVIQDNEYNEDIFKERVANLCSYIKHIKSKVEEVDAVYLFNLGDQFESLLANIREGMSQGMYSFSMEQYHGAKMMNEKVINTVLDEFDCDVEFMFVAGNHDRVTKNRRVNSEDIVIGMFADMMKEKYSDNDRVSINHSSPVCSVLTSNNVNIISSHGHIKEWKPKMVDRLINLFGYKDADRYLLLQAHTHHFHSDYNHEKCALIKIPSIIGGDDYSKNYHNVSSPPGMIGIHSTKYSDIIYGPYNLSHAEI